ncbi:MAG: hypothetical protein IKA44_05415 [Clostridia bacterium]|nr:hypothetical protein [Clostridia bacterium]
MKKLFAILLTAMMLLGAVPFVASAAPADATTTVVTVDSLDDFYWVSGAGTTDSPYALVNALDKEAHIKLTADLVFGDNTKVALKKVVMNATTQKYEYVYTDAGKTQIDTYEWTFANLNRGMLPDDFNGSFDGGGHSIVYTGRFERSSSGGFLSHGDLNGDVKDLTIGSKDQYLDFHATSGASRIGVLGNRAQIKKNVIENVVIYANLTTNKNGTMNNGIFYARTESGITFNNCRAYGTINHSKHTETKIFGVGGFTGSHACALGDSAPIYFNNCYAQFAVDAPACGESWAGGLVGTINCEKGDNAMIATNCVVDFTCDRNKLPNVIVGAGSLYGAVTKTKSTGDDLAKLAQLIDCNKPVFNAVGASVKIADGTLRFRVGATIYNAYSDLYGAQNVKVGVIYAEKATATTLGDNFKIDATGVTNVEVTGLDNGYVYANVTAANYATEYTALGYVQYTTDGTTWTTVYADAATTRSVSAVATAALADVKDVQGDGYGYATADGKYCFYTTEQQAKLASYIVASAS